jgi:hypothetical protein
MTRIGFLGTGIMGAPMAARLAAAAFAVTAWNRSPQKLAGLAGVHAAPTARAAVEGAEVVVCMLSSGEVCDAVLFGPEGVLHCGLFWCTAEQTCGLQRLAEAIRLPVFRQVSRCGKGRRLHPLWSPARAAFRTRWPQLARRGGSSERRSAWT